MRGSKDSLLLTVHGAMEFTWRYAWVGFITFVVVRRSFPLLEALGIFALASVVTLLSRGKGWRILYILVLQAAGLAFAAGMDQLFFRLPTDPYRMVRAFADFLLDSLLLGQRRNPGAQTSRILSGLRPFRPGLFRLHCAVSVRMDRSDEGWHPDT